VVPGTGRGLPSGALVTVGVGLLVPGVGAAVIGVFHDRLRRIALTRTGLEVTLTPAERDGLGALVERLARSGASSAKVAEAVRRYLDAVHSRRPARPLKSAVVDGAGLTAAQAHALADRIADELV